MLTTENVMRPVVNRIAGRPLCPNCGRPMHLTRMTPATGSVPDLRTYGCGECGVWLTEAAGDGPAD